MLGRMKDNTYTQICQKCGNKIEHDYKKVNMKKNKFINLPPCSICGSIEFIYLNDVDSEHGRQTSRLFAKAHKSKEKKDE
jgi:NAD-dependent SIR2 family protein deacetylase